MLRRPNQHRERTAFTLIELLLVLAVLVLLLGIAAPSMLNVMTDMSLNEAAQDMRREVTNTRLLAIETGQSYQFRYEVGGRKFVAVPVVLEATPEGTGVGMNSSATPPEPPLTRISGALPSDLVFAPAVATSVNGKTATKSDGTGIASQRLGPEWFAGLDEASEFAGANWSPPIVFYADGSSDGGALAIDNPKNQHHVTLTVRDLTGAITLGDIKREGLR